MTIKEKLCEPLGKFYIETSKELEEIADDYAIEFSEWCDDNYFRLGNTSFWIKSLALADKDKITTKELLEIFKKEKGL
jgi:hypothetical protein